MTSGPRQPARRRKPVGKLPGFVASYRRLQNERDHAEQHAVEDLAKLLLASARKHGGLVNSADVLGERPTDTQRDLIRQAIANLADRGLIHQPRNGAWRLVEAEPLGTRKC